MRTKFLIIFLVSCAAAIIGIICIKPISNQFKSTHIIKPVIDRSRIIQIDVKCHAFDDSIKTIKLYVLDVTAESVKKIFADLLNEYFPIYEALCYANRTAAYKDTPSLHAYGAAIDINAYINPYYNVLKGASSMGAQRRFVDIVKDEESIRDNLKRLRLSETETNATVEAIMRKGEPTDWFINRYVYRKGMLTEHHAEIFRKNGFTIWGGRWREPMDFMHVQIDEELAKQLASVTREKAAVIWKEHLRECQQIPSRQVAKRQN